MKNFFQPFLEKKEVEWGTKNKLTLFVNESLEHLTITQVEFVKNPQASLMNILIENEHKVIRKILLFEWSSLE